MENKIQKLQLKIDEAIFRKNFALANELKIRLVELKAQAKKEAK